MKNTLFALLFGLSFQLAAQTKEHRHPELQTLYASSSFEKLVVKADKIINGGKLDKNDPIPHMYLSMGLYAISQSDKKNEEMYASAWKESITHAATAIKRDISEELKGEQYYLDHILHLQEELLKFFENELLTWQDHKDKTKAELDKDTKTRDKMYGELSKANGYTGTFLKLSPRTVVSQRYFDATVKFLCNDKTGANTKWKEIDTQEKTQKKELAAQIAAQKTNPKLTIKIKTDSVLVSNFNTWNEPEKKMFIMVDLMNAYAFNKAAKNDKRDIILNRLKDLMEKNEDKIIQEFYEEELNKLGLKNL